MNKNKIRVRICNTSFTVSSEDAAEYTQAVAAEVDKEVRGILTSSAKISVTEASLLTALNYCDMCRKSEKTIDALRRRSREYLDSAARIRLQAEEYKREVKRLERENKLLRQRLQQLSLQQNGVSPVSAPVTSISKTENTIKLEDEEAAEE